MSVTLHGAGGPVHTNYTAWMDVLETALANGWEPQGAIPNDDQDKKSWSSREVLDTYLSNDFQLVTDNDAVGMLVALCESGVCPGCHPLVYEVIRLCNGGSFVIG